MISNNVWVDSNKFKLEEIKRFLVEESYKGTSDPGVVPPMVINNMLDGAIIEILRLQKTVDRLEADLKVATKKPEEKTKTKG